jgi:hypothetical protein
MSQLNLNLTNEQLLLINILNTMYNDNYRQINNLTASNNEIRNLLTRVLNNQNNQNNQNNTGRSRSNVRSRYNYHRNNTHQSSQSSQNLYDIYV